MSLYINPSFEKHANHSMYTHQLSILIQTQEEKSLRYRITCHMSLNLWLCFKNNITSYELVKNKTRLQYLACSPQKKTEYASHTRIRLELPKNIKRALMNGQRLSCTRSDVLIVHCGLRRIHMHANVPREFTNVTSYMHLHFHVKHSISGIRMVWEES